MDRGIDEGDMVIIRNRKSKFYQYSGMVMAINYDDDLERNIYKVKFEGEFLKDFYIQDLDPDSVENETTERQ